MPKFVFQYRVGDEIVEELGAHEHDDLEDAEESAVEWARRVMRRVAKQGENLMAPRSVEISDNAGHDLLYIVFWGAPDTDESETVH